MDQIINEINSPVWWFSVVVVGILVHIVSRYIPEWVASLTGGASSWWAKRSEMAREIRNERLAWLAGHPHRQTLVLFFEVRAMLGSIILFILSTYSATRMHSVTDSIDTTLWGILSVVSFFAGLSIVVIIGDYHKLVLDAQTGDDRPPGHFMGHGRE